MKNFLQNNKSKISSLFLIYLITISFFVFFITFFSSSKTIQKNNLEKQNNCSHSWVFISDNENHTKIKCKKCGINYYEYKEEKVDDKT